jgi:hypothetical protein
MRQCKFQHRGWATARATRRERAGVQRSRKVQRVAGRTSQRAAGIIWITAERLVRPERPLQHARPAPSPMTHEAHKSHETAQGAPTPRAQDAHKALELK